MMGNNRKRIKQIEPNRSKTLKHYENRKQVDTSENPSFSFKFCCEKKYGVNQLSNDLKKELIKRIFIYSKQKWNEIDTRHKHGWGSEKISQKEIRPSLHEIVTPDMTLKAIRFSGANHAMVGFREKGIFYILFLDHDFSVYNHG